MLAPRPILIKLSVHTDVTLNWICRPRFSKQRVRTVNGVYGFVGEKVGVKSFITTTFSGWRQQCRIYTNRKLSLSDDVLSTVFFQSKLVADVQGWGGA